jgi:phosphate transport system protein
MPERIVPHFQEELEQLKTRLLEMGGLAEDRVSSAVKGLVQRDAPLIDRVLAGDGPINQLHIEIDGRCFKLLALHQPMAVDLRSPSRSIPIWSGSAIWQSISRRPSGATCATRQ